MMNGDTLRWTTWRSSQRSTSDNKSGRLTWASLNVLSPKKNDDNNNDARKLRRRGSNETSSLSTSRPRFAAPITASSHSPPESAVAENEKMFVPNYDAEPRRLEPIHSYLMLSNADNRAAVVNSLNSFNAHFESSNTAPYKIGNLSVYKSSPHSSNYQVECMGEKFTGFHNILFDNTKFYETEVAPLAREFVNKQRNICIIVHGANGTGRRKVLFGHNNNDLYEKSETSYHRRQSDDHDSVSTLGSQGVSEIQNNNETSTKHKLRPGVQIVPSEVCVVESSPTTSPQRDRSPQRQNHYAPSTTNDEEKNTGIITKLMEDICKKLCRYHPNSSFGCNSGGRISDGHVPEVIPREQSSSRCLLKSTITNNAHNALPKRTMAPYRASSLETLVTDKAIVSSSRGDGSFVGVRVSCFEIVDDLASGETTTHDLLSECMHTEKWPKCVSMDNRRKQQFRRNSISCVDGDSSDDMEEILADLPKCSESSCDTLLSKNVIHDAASGIVYVGDSTEVRCFSKAAIVECLLKAEETRHKRKNGDDNNVSGKLFHTVYLISIEHNECLCPGKIALTRQFVVANVDETMTNSASLALHSSCSALNAVTRQLANYAAVPPSRRNVLTQLLSGCIGGDCRTLVIGTADPLNDDINLPTLRFAESISWVYNYWTKSNNNLVGEDESDTDSDDANYVESSAFINNVDCNSRSKELVTPSTELLSSHSNDLPQSNLVKEIKKPYLVCDSDTDTQNDLREALSQSFCSIGKSEKGIIGRDHDDSSWRATVAQIDQNLGLARAKLKSKVSMSTVGCDNISTDPLKIERKKSEHASALIPQDHPPAGGHAVQENKTKGNELDEMRAEIEALRQERDNLIRRESEKELEIEKAREDIFLLKMRQREDVSHSNSVEVNPKHSVHPVANCNKPEPIRVCLRVRPKSKLETYRRSAVCIEARDDSPNVRIDSLHGTHNFCFDKVFGTDSSQRIVSEFFKERFISKLLTGVNCALILCGAKSSGKSHSLIGEIPSASQAKVCSLSTDNAGILPNIIRGLYQKMRSNSTVSYTIKCSFVVVHLERIIDLLRPQSNEGETIFERYSHEGLHLDGATEYRCFEVEDVMDLIRRGVSFKSILSDTLSAENDFFHTCFLLRVTASTGKCATLFLSEMFGFGSSKKTNGAGLYANTSYHTSSEALKRVVEGLSRKVSEVPYHLSKVTSLLRDVLGGNCSTTVMINTSPCDDTYAETLGAIKLGLALRNVNNTPTANASDVSDLRSVAEGDKLRSIILDSQSKLTILRQQYNVLLLEKQATDSALNEERQKIKLSDLEKEKVNLEVKRLTLREKRATDFIKCLRGLVSDVKNDVDESRTLAMDQVIEMIGSDVDLSDLVDIDVLLQREGFISKDDMTRPPDDFLNIILGSECSDLSPTDVLNTPGLEERFSGDSKPEGGSSQHVRMLRRDLRKVAKANVELQVSLKREKEYVQNIVDSGDINTNKLANEVVAMKASRDKMCNCALAAVNKLNEIKSTNKMVVKQAKILKKHNKCIEDEMRELETKLQAAEAEVTMLENARLSLANEFKALTGSILFHGIQSTLSKSADATP